MDDNLRQVSLQDISHEFARGYQKVGKRLVEEVPPAICPPIRFNIAQDGRVNGCAYADFDNSGSIKCYHVTVNEGVAVNLMAMTVALLAQTTTLSEQRKYLQVDARDGCKGDPRVLRDVDWRFGVLPQIEQLNDPNAKYVTITSSRLAFAQAAAQTAMFFVILHEIQHIVLGHLCWLHRKFGLTSLSMTEIPGPVNATTFQGLETHADIISAFRFIDSYKDNATQAHANGFGISLLLHAIAGVPQSIDSYGNASHPHPFIRFCNLYSMEIAPEKKGQKVISPPAWRDGLWDATLALIDIGAECISTSPVRALLSTEKAYGDTAYSKVEDIIMTTSDDAYRNADKIVNQLIEYT